MEIFARNSGLPPFRLVIVAAGTGSRTGMDIPKQYAHLGDRCILEHTINAFKPFESLESVTVVISEDHEKLFHNRVTTDHNVIITYGGDDRKSSVYNGLCSIPNVNNKEIVLIHDAARPFVRPDDIARLLAAFETHDAATLACPMADTLRRGDKGISGATVDRNGLWAIQTPQAFRYGLIRQAHESANPAQSHTDDTTLVSDMGVDVALIPCGRHNFKITDAADMDLATLIVEGQNQMKQIRTGQGYDVHAFADESENRPLIICGVTIPHHQGLAGHSDADVGLHTITDALLGAIGAGDIGDHFPPSDIKWKDVDSSHFLNHVVEMIAAQHGTINNIDVTVIAEEPKLYPYKLAMKERVASICNLDPAQVNIKATTTEKLGFTGRKEGIAAQAVATVSLPDTITKSDSDD